jgi:hypothetical protein
VLFDLKGKRRRVVQATYLTLAVLMGGGLVLFGIGGDVQGGLFDAFSGEGGRGGGNSLIDQRVERAEKRLERNPRDQQALKELARGSYQLAAQEADPNTQSFHEDAKDNLRKSAVAWERYLALDPKKPDDSLARLMIQVYGQLALNRPAKATQAAEIVAEADPSAAAFLQLAQYATLAGQTRKADLAGKRAVDLAPKEQRRAVKDQVKQITNPALAGQTQGGGGQP